MEKVSLREFIGSNKTMICFVIVIILLLLLSPSVKAQKVSQVAGDQLAVSFAIFNNDYKDGGQPAADLVLTNKSKKTFPATGWKIYFNNKSMLKPSPGDGIFLIQKKNGNLFELSPGPAFKGIAPGKTEAAKILIDDIISNSNDQPEGFYIVWDDAPLKGHNIKDVTVKGMPLQKNGGRLISDFAETVFRNNAVIDPNVTGYPKIFPSPVSYTAVADSFELDGNTSVEADKLFEQEAVLLRLLLRKILRKGEVRRNAVERKGILLKYKQGLPAEGYELNVTAEKIEISASTTAGIFYGIQSFKTLLPPKAWSAPQMIIYVPGVNVSDAPRFPYRGFMLDVARNFQTKEEVLRILDLLALYKMNSFHFHLTEDEGWRLEINGLPELTDFGAKRGHTITETEHMPSAYGSGADTGRLYGSGYFTRQDFIEILKYAQERHIKVIPEIETPGHARAAIKAMDARYRRFMKDGKPTEALQYLLRDTLDQSIYNTPQWFGDNVMNVALPSVYTFVEKVISEVDAMYKEAGVPLTTIHLGGDEVPAGTWEKSPACNALIAKDPTLDNTDDLWYYYIGKVSDILKAKNISMSGWEEIGLRKTLQDGNKVMIPNPEFDNKDMRLYVWNNIGGNEDLAYRLANSGYKVILTPVTNYYFDMTQYKTYDDFGYYWGGVTDVAEAYEFIPFDYLKNIKEDFQGKQVTAADYPNRQRLTDYGKENILGLQAAIWSETIKGPAKLEYMLLPRLAALSERAWAAAPAWSKEADPVKMQAGYNTAWSRFVKSVGLYQLPLLEHYHGSYNYRIPPAGVTIENGTVIANTQFPGLQIRYTTDGSEPTATSKLYTTPIISKGIIRLKVFNVSGRGSFVTVVENE